MFYNISILIQIKFLLFLNIFTISFFFLSKNILILFLLLLLSLNYSFNRFINFLEIVTI